MASDESSTTNNGRMTNSHSNNHPAPELSPAPVVPRENTTRRQFLVNCSAVAATISVAPAALGRPGHGRAVALEQVDSTDFAQQLNTAFLVHPEGGFPVKLQLVEVRSFAQSGAAFVPAEDGANEKFAVLFRGTRNTALEQNTYTFEHRHIGTFEMFIVPVGYPDESQCYYEAVFNRPPRSNRERSFMVRSR